MRTVWRIGICFGLAVAIPAAAAAGAPGFASNDEYGYSVVFPAGAKPCPAMSWTHFHGDYAYYGVKAVSCGKDPGPGCMALSIWADYNTTFYATPRDGVSENCRETAAGALGLAAAIDGRPIVVCVKDTGGRKYVEATVMAGRLGKAFGEESGKPSRIYTVSLTTTADRLARDLQVFAVFMKSIRLTER